MSGRRQAGVGRVAGFLVQALAAVAVTAGLLAGLEGAAALYLRWAGAATLRDALTADRDQVATALRMLALNPDLHPSPLVEDAWLLWRNQPGARKTQAVNPRAFGRDAQWTVVINARGYRGPEVAPKPPRSYRILCVGDSITFGFNVDQPAPFARRVEELLRRRHPGVPVEVVNAGVPGWSWLQGVRFLALEGMALQPDLVIQAHGSNDQFFPAQITDRERLERPATALARALAVGATVVRRTHLSRAILSLLPPPPREGPSPGCRDQIRETKTCHRASLGDIAESVREAHRLTGAAGADFVVLNVDFMETPAASASRPAAEAAGVPFLDLVARFRDWRDAEARARAEQLGLAQARTETEGPRGPAATVRLRVLVPAGIGQVAVEGAGFLSGAAAFLQPLWDDGTHGDEVAGDRVFTATVPVPRSVPTIEYRFVGDGAPEFQPLPPFPSTQGFRVLAVTGDVTGPVEVFAELPLMAERTHPDARGHERIAEMVIPVIEQAASWKRVATGAGAMPDAR